MTRIALRRRWDGFLAFPAIGLPLAFTAIHNKISISEFAYPSFSFFLAAPIAMMLVFILAQSVAMAIWLPSLIVDSRGMRFDWIAWRWSVLWTDVEDIGIYVGARGSTWLAFKVQPGTPLYSPAWRFFLGGFDKLIPHSYVVSDQDLLDTIEANRDFLQSARPLHPDAAPSAKPVFGHRSVAPVNFSASGNLKMRLFNLSFYTSLAVVGLAVLFSVARHWIWRAH
jgi:hypothetical protein